MLARQNLPIGFHLQKNEENNLGSITVFPLLVSGLRATILQRSSKGRKKGHFFTSFLLKNPQKGYFIRRGDFYAREGPKIEEIKY
jgi:hypothetical protein